MLIGLPSQRRGVTLHSGKNQEQREAALQSLRDGDVEVLVATDLVSTAGRSGHLSRLTASTYSHPTGRSWYRCARRHLRNQLADGVHHRKIRPSYRSYRSCGKDWYCHHLLGQRGRGDYV